MGGLFSGSTRTTSESTPWQPQGDALRGIFTAAGENYNNRAGTPWYEGELFAGMDPATSQSIRSMMEYTQGRGNQSVNQFNQTGDALVNPQGYTSAIDRFSAAAGADPTQSNIASATAYANNPAIDGMIDAASRDVSRNLYENEIPGINRAGTGSGNINSSRAGVAEGVATRGASDRIGDISSNIRGDAFNRGLSMAEGARTTNLSAMGQSAGLYGQSTGMGLDALQGGNALSLGNSGANIDGSRLFQADAQGRLDADFRGWQGNDSREDDLLARYSLRVAGFAAAAGRNREIGNDSRKIVNVIDLYVSPFGEYKVVLNRFMLKTVAWLLDPEMWKKVTLRPWTRSPLAKTGDSNRQMLVGEYGLKNTNYLSSPLIENLTAV